MFQDSDDDRGVVPTIHPPSEIVTLGKQLPQESGFHRKSDLKRGKFVDKNREPSTRTSSATNLKRIDSLTKKDKQNENVRRREESSKENKILEESTPATKKLLKTLVNQRRIKRRHTVGGTKDFEDFNKIVKRKEGKCEGDSNVTIGGSYTSHSIQNSCNQIEAYGNDPYFKLLLMQLRSSSPELYWRERGWICPSGAAEQDGTLARLVLEPRNKPNDRRLSLPPLITNDSTSGVIALSSSLLESQV